mmetsp:Transcript_15299/g.33246  ORF Transcript_15299/g.33246 Transcript_15299/m.33246 type:complete len:371 (+) Transcript_15299:167-1279(+)
MARQRHEENIALGIRREALRQWSMYKMDIDDAEKAAKTNGRYNRVILGYARKAIQDKRHELFWANKAFGSLQKAMREEAEHPERYKPEKKLSKHEKLRAAADPIDNYEIDPFHDHRPPPTAMQKAEKELERRVFHGDATRSEYKAYDQLQNMHDWLGKKREATFMGEALEKVRKKYYAGKFDTLLTAAERKARLADKYTGESGAVVEKARRYTKAQQRLLAKLRAVRSSVPVKKVKVKQVNLYYKSKGKAKKAAKAVTGAAGKVRAAKAAQAKAQLFHKHRNMAADDETSSYYAAASRAGADDAADESVDRSTSRRREYRRRSYRSERRDGERRDRERRYRSRDDRRRRSRRERDRRGEGERRYSRRRGL